MTWTWDIEGLGTKEQTLRVISPNGTETHTETQEGWSWSGERPEVVTQTVAKNDVSAALSGDIERPQS